MGTHISRVKSVDLDAWTDEQLQSILNWGNARANKYWEAKLAANHVPSEAKIENFIRTKYELKRWAMEGPIPDPATLDADGDDDVPLSVVKEKQNVERRESVRKASVGRSAAPQVDLIGGDQIAAPVPPPLRASSTGPTTMQVPPKSGPAPPKATSTKDSLLGLDFLGGQVTAPPRPASTTGTPSSGHSRPDLKQSILSLYATAPRPQPQQTAQHVSHAPSGSLSGMSSPTGMSQVQNPAGGLNDAFSSLSFASASSPKPAQNDAFSGLGSFGSPRPAPQSNNSAFSALSGGSFFDSKPAAASHQQKQSVGSTSGWGSAASPAAAPKPAPAPASSALGDLFDFSASSPPAPVPQPALAPTTTTTTSSVFNLSAPQPKPSPPTTTSSTTSNPLGSLGGGSWGGSDVWGGNAWSAEAPKASPEPPKPAAAAAPNDMGWASLASQPIVPGSSGGFAPKVAADEEFGGWTSSTTTSNTNNTSKPATGFGGGGEDLFSNVWQ